MEESSRSLVGWLLRPRAQGTTTSEHSTAPWYWTLWLTGVDYFSSLGYAPYLAVASAGYLAPVATLLLVLVTFLCAVPTYAFVARHSHEGLRASAFADQDNTVGTSAVPTRLARRSP